MCKFLNVSIYENIEKDTDYFLVISVNEIFCKESKISKREDYSYLVKIFIETIVNSYIHDTELKESVFLFKEVLDILGYGEDSDYLSNYLVDNFSSMLFEKLHRELDNVKSSLYFSGFLSSDFDFVISTKGL